MMKNYLSAIVGVFLLFSCSKKENVVDEISGIYTGIDSTLQVTTRNDSNGTVTVDTQSGAGMISVAVYRKSPVSFVVSTDDGRGLDQELLFQGNTYIVSSVWGERTITFDPEHKTISIRDKGHIVRPGVEIINDDRFTGTRQ